MLQIIIDIALLFLYFAIFLYLLALTYRFWILYVQTKNRSNLKYILLEIKLPREINKNPAASEIWIRSLIEGGGLGNWHKEKWLGNLPVISSLEIVSIEGVIHFYVRIEKKLRERVEAAIYSQYPDVEIIEAEDYINLFSFDRKNSDNFWGCEWKLGKKGEGQLVDKDKKTLEEVNYVGDMYPIKTYVDWGLDRNEKEIYKNDPLTYFLETISMAGNDEFWCHQIIFRDAGKWNNFLEIKDKKENVLKITDIKELAKIEIEKYKSKWSLKKKGDLVGNDDYGNIKTDKDGNPLKYGDTILSQKITPEQERDSEAKEAIKSIQRKISKPLVIATMRTIIIGKDSSKKIGSHIATHMSLMKPFNEDGYNIFVPTNVADPYTYPWENIMKRRVPWRKDELYNSYIGRGGLISLISGNLGKKTELFLDLNFYNYSDDARDITEALINIFLNPFKSYKLNGFILNTEELATLYHFPGEVAATPSLPRIDSIKGSAPSNLPK